MVQTFSLINMLNCLPPLLALDVLKHVPTRLIILIGRKNNHKIKIAGTGQLAVGIGPLGCKYTFYHFQNADRIEDLYGAGGEKEGTGVKWASHCY